MAEATGIGVDELGLLTDLYQLTMAQSYFHHRHNGTATFSLFIRSYPPDFTYFVAAGLATVLEYLEAVHFPPSALAYLRQTGRFTEDFLAYLANWRFRGDVVAMPEGTVFFVNEPILEVTAPIIDAQLVESFVINAVHLQTLVATKAARCVQAARGRALIDFALRRTHGTDAAMKVARASYLAGFEGTSNVLAGRYYGIPISGTMAHSYIMSFADELEAFRAFAATYPDQTVLLIDTYDTLVGARHAVQVGQELARAGHKLRGVRLDSGDIAALSKQVRAMLDAAGLNEVRIVASGGLDEYAIDAILRAGGCVDVFGVGTRMGVSAGAPYYDIAYKLVKYDGRPVAKLSADKATLPEDKQVWRCTRDGHYVEDILTLRDEAPPAPAAEPLLQEVMRDGRRLGTLPSLHEARDRHLEAMRRLPEPYRRLSGGATYPVRLSAELRAVQQEVESELLQHYTG
ncbi:MAG: nicotinate phosphoribosyltransferase pncB2 [Candidatus Tectimicrobiota bacterium]|nr:MAG: nicotinate phosphoribosyltransferase pncB2 [Candidatus Tectomicrobia bacterium]